MARRWSAVDRDNEVIGSSAVPSHSGSLTIGGHTEVFRLCAGQILFEAKVVNIKTILVVSRVVHCHVLGPSREYKFLGLFPRCVSGIVFRTESET